MFSTKKARINVIIWKWTTGTSFGTSYNVQNLSCLFRSTGLTMTTLRMSIHQLTILVGPHWGTICLEWIFLVKINSFRIRQKCFHFSQNFSKWFKRQSSFLFKNGKREKNRLIFSLQFCFDKVSIIIKQSKLHFSNPDQQKVDEEKERLWQVRRGRRKRERESKRGSVLSDIKMTKSKMQLLIYFLSTSEKERDTQRFGLRKKKVWSRYNHWLKLACERERTREGWRLRKWNRQWQ